MGLEVLRHLFWLGLGRRASGRSGAVTKCGFDAADESAHGNDPDPEEDVPAERGGVDRGRTGPVCLPGQNRRQREETADEEEW